MANLAGRDHQTTAADRSGDASLESVGFSELLERGRAPRLLMAEAEILADQNHAGLHRSGDVARHELLGREPRHFRGEMQDKELLDSECFDPLAAFGQG